MKLYQVLFLSVLLCFGCAKSVENSPTVMEEPPTKGFYVAGLENVGARVSFYIDIESTADFQLRIVGFNNSLQKTVATCSLYVNGEKKQQISFDPSSEWEQIYVDTFLVQGENEISIVHDGGDNGLCYLDYIEVISKQ